MAIDSGKLKHLEILQQASTRMAGNSFNLCQPRSPTNRAD